MYILSDSETSEIVRYYTKKVRYGKTFKAIIKEPAESHILMTVQAKIVVTISVKCNNTVLATILTEPYFYLQN